MVLDSFEGLELSVLVGTLSALLDHACSVGEMFYRISVFASLSMGSGFQVAWLLVSLQLFCLCRRMVLPGLISNLVSNRSSFNIQ